MEFIGIDLGAYKTVIASSRDNGKIVTDEQGKRGIRTVIERTEPIRKFGNSITGEHELTIDLRHRDFIQTDPESLFMWLKYLDRTIKKHSTGNPTICLAIPPYFGEIQRRTLLGLAEAAGMKVRGFFNDISAVGMFACIRREKTQKRFMIIDLGHHKTEVGVFSYSENVFRPEYIKAIEVGAEKFDGRLVDFIIHKYNLEDKKIVREKIGRSLEKIKTVLNASPTASVQIYVSENPLNVQITQEEFSVLVRKEVEQISQFIDQVLAETSFDGIAEVTGGNSSSFLIKGILDKKVKYQSTLDLTESCAIGASLGFACSVIKSKFKINDILGRDISVQAGKDAKKSLVFKACDLVGTSKTVTYKKKESFDIMFYEENTPVASLEIIKEESEEPVTICLEITRFGTVEVKSVDSKSYKYHVHTIPEENLKKITETEDSYREMEESIELIGTMRNDLETMAMALPDFLSSKFDNLFSSDEIDQIRNIGFELFDVPPSSSVKAEEQVRDEIHSKLDFVTQRIQSHWSSVKEVLQKYSSEIRAFNLEHPKVFTPTFYKLQGLLYKIEDKIKSEPVDLYSIASYEFNYLDQFGKDLKDFVERSRKEIKEKLELEKKAKEEAMKEESKGEEKPQDEPKGEDDKSQDEEAKNDKSQDEDAKVKHPKSSEKKSKKKK